MKAAAVKSNKPNESRAAANSIFQKKSDPKGALRFADNRPGPAAGRLKDVPNSTPGSSTFIRICAPSPVVQTIQQGAYGDKTLRNAFPSEIVPSHSPSIQRTLQTGGNDTDATTLLLAAQPHEGYGIWQRNGDLAAFETVSSVVDITYAPGNVVVTIDGIAANGSPFATIVAAIDALEAQVFVSLAADQTAGRYTLTATPNTAIRRPSGEANFDRDYSGGKSVADAVEEAIAGLDLTGSNTAPHARHDFQPSGPTVKNLQVQLGGASGDYRRGLGDTSSTLVVVTTTKWDELLAADANRFKKVIQEAHRQSFANRQRIDIS